jgi:hypothetical protein
MIRSPSSLSLQTVPRHADRAIPVERAQNLGEGCLQPIHLTNGHFLTELTISLCVADPLSPVAFHLIADPG